MTHPKRITDEGLRSILTKQLPDFTPDQILAIQRAFFQEEEPWNTTTDTFLALPGSVGSSDFPLPVPPNGQYCKLSFQATSTAPQRILVKQGGSLDGTIHTGGRVVGRYFGDESLPHLDSFFTSNGEEVWFEFQQYATGIGKWYAYENTIEDIGDATNKKYMMRGAGADFQLQFGPSIVAPQPTPHGFLWVAGKANCTNIFLGSVQTTYAYAWATLTEDPNGPKLSVPSLSVKFTYDDFPQGPVANAAQNTSQVEASEQIRRTPGNCSGVTITANGVGPDGQPYQAKTIHVDA